MAKSRQRWAPWRRSTRLAATRVLKWLLCAMLIVGLVPGSEEVVESVSHLVHDGHLPHSKTHDEVAVSEDCGGESDEHGCTPMAHHCRCCASVAALPPRLRFVPVPLFTVRSEPRVVTSERRPPIPALEPFFRPPIA